jgi:hypothetical protein
MTWQVVTLDKFVAHESIHGGDFKKTWNGYSPGGAAAELDMTRQGIHKAVDRGLMKGFRVMRGGSLMMLLIPQREIDHYREHHLDWVGVRGKPRPFLQKTG